MKKVELATIDIQNVCNNHIYVGIKEQLVLKKIILENNLAKIYSVQDILEENDCSFITQFFITNDLINQPLQVFIQRRNIIVSRTLFILLHKLKMYLLHSTLCHIIIHVLTYYNYSKIL